MIKLRDISTIRIGITLRNSITTSIESEVAVLQPRDFQDGELVKATTFINSQELKNVGRHLLKINDILIVNKGMKFESYLINDNYPKSVASGSFFIINCNEAKCLPGYLEWYLQQPSTKEYLLKNSSATTITSLGKICLEELPIVLPNIQLQHKIVSIIKVAGQKHLVLQDLIRKNQEFKNNYIWEIIKFKSE